MIQLDKQYQPHDVEKRWLEYWDQLRLAHADETRDGETFSMAIPPPNITGSLHMGHAFNNTLQDIMARWQRMRGINTLWQPGTDHAGIATQNVVERQLKTEGLSRQDLGREKFVERVWQWKKESGGNITHQLVQLGCSLDWERDRFTMDEGLSRAVREVFVSLYDEGLIYKGDYIINWCPRCHTALSDLEVEHQEKPGHLYHIKYPLKDGSGALIVATTRPETMLGDTAVAVHESDARYQDLIGKYAILPLVGRRIPIVADEHADPEQGSGAVKITPAHDFNDFEVGRRHDLEMINIFDENAILNDQVPTQFQGLDRETARKRVVEEMEALDLLEKIEDNPMTVPYGDRSGEVIEPRLTDQWFVDAETLAKPAIEAVEKGRIKFVPEHWSNT